MANLAAITYITPTGRPDSLGYGGAVVVAQGTFPSGAATATCPIGDLASTDHVTVHPVTTLSSNTVPYIEILASRTNSQQGVVTIGTQDGSNSPNTFTVRVVKYKV